MDINNIIESIYKELMEIDKIAPYILGAFALIVFTIRSVYAFKYSLNYQEKFGVPYHRFDVSFNKNLVEKLLQIALLLVFIVAQYIFAVNYFKVSDAICAILCTIFVFGYNFVIFTPLAKKYTMKYVWHVTIIVTVAIMLAVAINLAYFPLAKENYNMIETILILYSAFTIAVYFIYLVGSFTYTVYKCFEKDSNPQSGEYEVVTLNDEKYAVVLDVKDETILVKLKNENGKLSVIKSDYMIVKSIEGKNIEYLYVNI